MAVKEEIEVIDYWLDYYDLVYFLSFYALYNLFSSATFSCSINKIL